MLDRIWETKHRNCLMFSYPQPITECLIRWVDEENPEHYNKNHFLALENLTIHDIQAAIAFQKQHKRRGFLLKSRKKLSDDIIAAFQLQEEEQYIMALQPNRSCEWKVNSNIQIKDWQEEDISRQLMSLCLSIADSETQKRWIRHTLEEALRAAKNHSNYHWFVVFQNGVAIARAYAFEACSCVQMEDLWVHPGFRNQGVATSLMKYVAEHFVGDFFLHVSAGDGVEVLYRKLGFEVVDKLYEYSKVWGQNDE